MKKPIRLVYIVTHPMTARLLLQGQLRFMQRSGFDVTVLSSPGSDLSEVREREGVETLDVPMHREISPWNDLKSLARLYRTLRRLQPDIVNAGTPKAGLLGMIAAKFAGVPVRIYTLRGLRLQTKRGFSRKLLRWTERIAAGCSTRVLCVSPSLRRAYLDLHLAPETKMTVLGKGSSNGLNLERFPEGPDPNQIRELRTRLQILENAPVIGFVGRFTRDKGFEELLQAFDRIKQKHPETRLLLLGDFEDGDPVPANLVRRMKGDDHIVMPGFVSDTAPYYRLMNVLAFPSYREGFPNVPLEAAASCVPTVGFRVTGTMDALEDGKTGILVEARDVDAFAEALCRILENPALQKEMGCAARTRVVNDFRQPVLWDALLREYQYLLGEVR